MEVWSNVTITFPDKEEFEKNLQEICSREHLTIDKATFVCFAFNDDGCLRFQCDPLMLVVGCQYLCWSSGWVDALPFSTCNSMESETLFHALVVFRE